MENVIYAAVNLASSLEENTTVVHAEKLFVTDIQKRLRGFSISDSAILANVKLNTHTLDAVIRVRSYLHSRNICCKDFKVIPKMFALFNNSMYGGAKA